MIVDADLGEKGTGKTPVMLEILTREAKTNTRTWFCGVRQKRQSSHPALRPIHRHHRVFHSRLRSVARVHRGHERKDYDISHIFIDSVFKIAGDKALEGLPDFISRLEKLARLVETNITLSISCAIDELPKLPDSIEIHVPRAN